MHPVHTVVTQEKFFPDFITPQQLTVQGICAYNQQIFRIYKGKHDRLYEYVPYAKKSGGSALGTIYNRISSKTNQSKTWLGKVGNPKGLLRNNPDTYRTRTEKEINFD
ncbi:MAG: hypothetical protein ACXU9U_03810, partial [Parachlamydiaceae bacterium]